MGIISTVQHQDAGGVSWAPMTTPDTQFFRLDQTSEEQVVTIEQVTITADWQWNPSQGAPVYGIHVGVVVTDDPGAATPHAPGEFATYLAHGSVAAPSGGGGENNSAMGIVAVLDRAVIPGRQSMWLPPGQGGDVYVVASIGTAASILWAASASIEALYRIDAIS